MPCVEAASLWWTGFVPAMANYISRGILVMMQVSWLVGLGHEVWKVLGLVLAHWLVGLGLEMTGWRTGNLEYYQLTDGCAWFLI